MEQNHQVGNGRASRSRRDMEARKGRPRRPSLESLESRELLSVSEYSILPAENNNTNSEPLAIVSGPDGNLWFTDLGTSEIGKINPSTDAITMYSNGLTPDSSPEGMTAGPDGNLWFVETKTSKIGMINPSTGAITEYSQGISAGASPVGITSGPDGNLWFTEFSIDKIGRINPSTGVITEYSSGISKDAEPEQITVGADGNLWFTEQGTASIGRINPTTGVVTEYHQGITSKSFPTGITSGSDGNLWFTEYYDQKIGMINPTTGAVTEYPISTAAESNFNLVGITTGSDGNLWLTAPVQKAGAILSFDPTTHAVTTDVTSVSAGPYGIAYGPDGNVWFTEIDAAVGNATVATHLSLAVQAQPTTIAQGATFGLTINVDESGAPDTHFNGPVTIALANNPGGSALGGTKTVTAVNGVATFSNLTLNNPGNDYTFRVSSNALTPIITGGIDVTSSSTPTPTSPTPTPTSPTPTPTSPTPTPTSPTPTPTSPTPTPTTPTPTPTSPTTTPTPTPTAPPTPAIVAERIVLAYLKHNKKGKPIGKPVVEVALTFSTAMNPGSLDNAGNYQVSWASTKKVKKQVRTILHPIAVVSATTDATDTVVTLATSAQSSKFAKGGQVSIVSPSSVLGAASGSLGGTTVFTISPRAGESPRPDLPCPLPARRRPLRGGAGSSPARPRPIVHEMNAASMIRVVICRIKKMIRMDFRSY